MDPKIKMGNQGIHEGRPCVTECQTRARRVIMQGLVHLKALNPKQDAEAIWAEQQLIAG